MTIKYLSRARPRFDGEPRLYVYLGVSNFRLGNQAEAEKLIEQATPLATNDPDVYYCRAEIFQRVNTARSVEDIKRYLDMIGKLHAQGVPINDAKQARVQRMLQSLDRGGARQDGSAEGRRALRSLARRAQGRRGAARPAAALRRPQVLRARGPRHRRAGHGRRAPRRSPQEALRRCSMGVASGTGLAEKREAYRHTLSDSDRRPGPRSSLWNTF
jgi:tetratricopeptide (TPR) repeat protein